MKDQYSEEWETTKLTTRDRKETTEAGNTGANSKNYQGDDSMSSTTRGSEILEYDDLPYWESHWNASFDFLNSLY